MKAVFLTAGAAGMYCGSCLHDNAVARALRDAGVDCLLQPVYTPIRADGPSAATDRVFFGGIHIYLLQQMPWLRRVPRPLRRALDWPPLIRLATRRSQSTAAEKLGALAVSMLQGKHGNQAEEVDRLVDWLCEEMRPDAIVLSNLLIGGALPEIRRRLPNTRLLVILQGDDIFLDHLPDHHRERCIELCRELVGSTDRFVFNSRFYAEKLGSLFEIPHNKRVITPLSIDTGPFGQQLDAASQKPASPGLRLGYLARIAPEKGLHHLVDAFAILASRPEHSELTLHAAGWLGDSNRDYLSDQHAKLEAAGVADRFTYHGSPDLEAKVDFLRTLDLLSVPTDYQEPKGLFVLEALAAGVPVIQPDHGAFAELLTATGGGVLVPPGDPQALAEAISKLARDHEQRSELARRGHATVHANHTIQAAAEHLRALMFDPV